MTRGRLKDFGMAESKTQVDGVIHIYVSQLINVI